MYDVKSKLWQISSAPMPQYADNNSAKTRDKSRISRTDELFHKTMNLKA